MLSTIWIREQTHNINSILWYISFISRGSNSYSKKNKTPLCTKEIIFFDSPFHTLLTLTYIQNQCNTAIKSVQFLLILYLVRSYWLISILQYRFISFKIIILRIIK